MAEFTGQYDTEGERNVLIAMHEGRGRRLLHDNHIYMDVAHGDEVKSIYQYGEMVFTDDPTAPPTLEVLALARTDKRRMELVAKGIDGLTPDDAKAALFIALGGLL